MDLNLAPVTLVVKAPNQKIEDQVIECGLGWTISKLKEHLSNVYPNKPMEHHQKLIYSGRLLTDQLVLKDVLRQYEEDQTTHTVHLVCAQEAMHTSEAPASTTSPTTSAASTATDGLRHRSTATTSTPAPPAAPAPQVVPQQQGMPQMYQGLDPMMYGGYYPGQMMYTPEQMAWMQQMYAQQMQYMQYHYYQQAGLPTPQTPHTPHTTAAGTVPVAQPAAAPPQQPANDQPQQIRMNAQGGPVADDDDAGRHRDWLDWLYTVARFMVVISIVYFNSSLSRFLVVVGVTLLFYMYQTMWVRLRRAGRQQPAAQPAAAAPAPAPAEPEPAPAPEAAAEQNAPLDETQGEGEESEGSEEAPAEPATPPPPPPPSVLQVTWSFITTFFSSLIPAQPAPVNAN